MSDRPGHHDEDESPPRSSGSSLPALIIAIVALLAAFLVPRFQHQASPTAPSTHDAKLSIRVDSLVVALTAANTKIDSLRSVVTEAQRIYTEGTTTNEARAEQLDVMWKDINGKVIRGDLQKK